MKLTLNLHVSVATQLATPLSHLNKRYLFLTQKDFLDPGLSSLKAHQPMVRISFHKCGCNQGKLLLAKTIYNNDYY